MESKYNYRIYYLWLEYIIMTLVVPSLCCHDDPKGAEDLVSKNAAV